MHLRAFIVAAALIVFPPPLLAQEVRVDVVELSNGTPVVGANVSLVDDHGMTIPGNFSDQNGRTVLRAPRSGAYILRADKIGYDTWTSVILHVTGTPIRVRAGMSPSRTPTTVVAAKETACRLLTPPGTPAGDLWVEIRKALTANALTEARGLVPLDIDLYERTLDRNLGIVSEKSEQRTRVPRRPAIGISWNQTDSVRGVAAGVGATIYRPPDAATLVSEQFVKSHCFAVITGYGPETGLTGLEFKPAKIGSQPELTGVLWLDPKADALRSLNFDYVNLPIPLRVARTSGRVEFHELPGGEWIVPKWYIRLPRVSLIPATDSGSAPVMRDTLTGYQEVGGVARPAGTPAQPPEAKVQPPAPSSPIDSAPSPPPPPPATAPQSFVSGIVYDSTAGRPLGGVRVSAGRGRFTSMTNAAGRYELGIDAAVSDTIVFDHTRLRLFRIPDRLQSIVLPVGAHG